MINKAKNENRIKNDGTYYEEHHIIPKSLGGTNDKSNLVLLTAREHFIAHWILTKIYKGNPKMICAFNSFCMSLNKDPSLSKNYEHARQKVSNLMRTEYNPAKAYGENIKETTYVNNGKISKRIKKDDLEDYLSNGWQKGRKKFVRKSHSMETRQKISIANKGKKTSQASIDFFKNNKHFWLSKNGKSIQVFEYDLQKYLDEGWVRGRHVLRNYDVSKVKYFAKNNLVVRVDVEKSYLYEKYKWKEVDENTYKNRLSMEHSINSWMHDERHSFKVSNDEVPIYLELGYKVGRGKIRR